MDGQNKLTTYTIPAHFVVTYYYWVNVLQMFRIFMINLLISVHFRTIYKF